LNDNTHQTRDEQARYARDDQIQAARERDDRGADDQQPLPAPSAAELSGVWPSEDRGHRFGTHQHRDRQVAGMERFANVGRHHRHDRADRAEAYEDDRENREEHARGMVLILLAVMLVLMVMLMLMLIALMASAFVLVHLASLTRARVSRPMICPYEIDNWPRQAAGV
jgi:hypothetical protein